MNTGSIRNLFIRSQGQPRLRAGNCHNACLYDIGLETSVALMGTHWIPDSPIPKTLMTIIAIGEFAENSWFEAAPFNHNPERLTRNLCPATTKT